MAWCSHAQQDTFIKKAQRNLDSFNDRYEPESIDVTLDKDFYFTGQKIWYSLHLSNPGVSRGSLSAVAYVELRGGGDSVVIRQKIKCNDGAAHGEISLPEQLPTGYFKLVAYTLWMKNTGGNNIYEELIPVVNLNAPLEQYSEMNMVKGDPGLLEFEKADSGTYIIRPPAGIVGELFAFSRQDVFFHQTVLNDQPVMLTCKKERDRHIYVVLLDKGGKMIDGVHLWNNPVNTLSLAADRKVVLARSKAELTIDLHNESGMAVEGKVAISVRPRIPFRAPGVKLVRLRDARPIVDPLDEELPFSKELFVSPPSKGTLEPIRFSMARPVSPFVLHAPEELVFLSEMKERIKKFYGINMVYEPEDGYNLPYNNSYQPQTYSSIPTLEEFIREIIPQVKVRKLKGQKVLLLRNSDNPSFIYFYKEPALILADGMVLTSANDLLGIPVGDVERIDVLWGTREINSTNMFALADNGVVSVRTKSRRPIANAHTELFKNFHNPVKFTGPKSDQIENNIPQFFDPVYWDPTVKILGKTRLSFQMSDDLGDFVVVVKGFSERGDYLEAEVDFKVEARSK